MRIPRPADLTPGVGPEAVAVLARAGLLRPSRPDRLLASALAFVRWGVTPVAGYAVAAARFPDEPAVIDDAGTVTFAALHRRAAAIAAGLAELGVGEGTRVGLLCRNHRGMVEACIATGRLGGDVVLLNTGFAAPQLAAVLRAERVRVLVHDEEFTEVAEQAAGRRRRVLAWHDLPTRRPTLDGLAAEHDGEDPPAPGRTGRVVILTSGTTGTPKGAERSKPGGIDTAVALLSRIPFRSRETTLVAAPLFHAWGFANLMLGTLLSSTIVLQRRFDPAETLSATARHRANSLVAVPVMLQRLLELPEPVRAARRAPSLRIVAVSGSALSPTLSTRFMDAYGDVLHNLYGSTEVGWAAIATPEDMRAAPGTVGRPPHGTVVRLLDERGNEVAPGASGRIFVGSSLVFEGYTGGGDKERIDGLAATGDIGRFDDAGRLFVEGRDDEMIVSGGENVFPAEVEDVLSRHPDVSDVAVIGVEDAEFGQRLAAWVVARDGARIDPERLRGHVRAHLARYKVPRDIHVVDELPRNPAGKVLKRVLAESAAKPPKAAAGAPKPKATAGAPKPKAGAPTAKATAGKTRRPATGARTGRR